MSTNFTRSSESIIFVTEILGYIVGITSVTCSLSLIFVAVRNSPREMSAYKWYIIFHAASCAGYDFLYGLLHPETFFPQFIFMQGGLFKYSIIPTYLLYFLMYAAVLFFFGPLLSAYHALVNYLRMQMLRYLQSINSRFLKLFSRGLPSLVFCSAGFCILTVPPFIGVTASDIASSQSELKEFLRVNQPMIYVIAQNRNIIGIKNLKGTFLYAGFCWGITVMLLYSATLTYCVYGCYASLQRGKSAFSSRSLMLYRSLVNALMIDLAICVIMVIFPCGLVGICLYFQLEWASNATLLAMSFASWYPCVSHIVWMWFIAPYRRALIRIFKGRGRTAQDKNSNILQLSAFSKQTKL